MHIVIVAFLLLAAWHLDTALLANFYVYKQTKEVNVDKIERRFKDGLVWWVASMAVQYTLAARIPNISYKHTSRSATFT